MADLYGPGRAHARKLIASGKVNQGAWSFSAEDGNKILGATPDWTAYGSWHLGHDPSATQESKAAWKYPFGKNGEVYAAALRAAASRASQQGDTAIGDAASALLDETKKSGNAAEPAEASVTFGKLMRAAAIQPSSVDASARTFDVIWTTGAAVKRMDLLTGQAFEERLAVVPSAVRLDRLNNGAPFLNSHQAFGLGSQIGTVVEGSAVVKDGIGTATVRLSRRADVEPIWRDIQDAIIRNISVGYDVHRYERTEDSQGRLLAVTAVDWEPYEISGVPMGADDGAKIRAADPSAAKAIPVTLARVAAPMKEPPTMEPISTVVAPSPVSEPSEPNERDVAQLAERQRVQGILNGCRAARLPQSFADKLIADGTDLTSAQTQILDTLRKDGLDSQGPRPGPSQVRVGADPLENVWKGISGALLNRIDADKYKLDDNSRQYRSRSLLACAEECLEQRGVRTRHLTKTEIAHLAFQPMNFEMRAGLHTTSDFANILADVGNKRLRDAYMEAPQTFEPIVKRVPAQDFKSIKMLQLSDAPPLLKVLEHGEFTRGTMSDGKEEFSLATYGRIFGITRQALINDDLGAFGRITASFGRSSRNLESDIVWYQILKNANMADGVALFHANHNNLAGSSAVISVTSLGIGRAAITKQTGLDGVTYMSLRPRYLIVPPSLETVADQFTTQITPALSSSVNPFQGRLTVISEPRLEGGVTVDGDTVAGSATAWYLSASNDQIDMVMIAFLDGENGPVMDSRIGFDIDGVETKCRFDLAAKVTDFRGLFKNSGA